MILVVGATGNLGGAVTRILLAQGQPVRILVRSQSNYQPLRDARAQVVLGDLKEPGSLDAACQGVETVITTANSAARGGEDTVQAVDLEGNRHLINAAKAAGVKQFIFVSALTADPTSPIPFAQAKGQTEDYLRESGLPYTILAPNRYMEMWIGMIVGMPALVGQPVTIYERVLGHRIPGISMVFLPADNLADMFPVNVRGVLTRDINRLRQLTMREESNMGSHASLYCRTTSASL